MKCKNCKSTMCEYRSTNAEQDCVLTVSGSINTDWEEVRNLGLRFENGRIYTVEQRQKPNKYPYEVKIDVTDQIAKVMRNSLRLLELCT